MPSTKESLSEYSSAFSQSILSWYRHNARALPWREAPSLYRTVVSEFMCQQTQIATVLPYFERWMAQLPDFESLAAAREDNVVKLWEGLGYYSRARNLHKLARKWVDADPKPQTASEWLKYPGVGAYTAAAISSISFGKHSAVVDGNVVRILARLTNDETQFNDNSKAVKNFTQLANDLIRETTHPGDHNQAMMELGATLCTKANPQCLLCPVQEYCTGLSQGDPARLPNLAKRKITAVTLDRAFIVHNGRLLLHRIPADAKRLAGMCEIPPGEQINLRFPAELIISRRRGIANERIEERFFRIVFSKEVAAIMEEDDTLFLHPLDQLDQITLTGPHRKWLHELLQEI
ncbi:MAG: A/G-specific adenine glycosylase [Verrucomicrobiota bacterium]